MTGPGRLLVGVDDLEVDRDAGRPVLPDDRPQLDGPSAVGIDEAGQVHRAGETAGHRPGLAGDGVSLRRCEVHLGMDGRGADGQGDAGAGHGGGGEPAAPAPVRRRAAALTVERGHGGGQPQCGAGGEVGDVAGVEDAPFGGLQVRRRRQEGETVTEQVALRVLQRPQAEQDGEAEERGRRRRPATSRHGQGDGVEGGGEQEEAHEAAGRLADLHPTQV